MADLFMSCGYTLSPDDCGREFIFLSDGALLQARSCSNESCSGYQTCINRIVDGSFAQ
jgi:hypothetical protein